MKKQRGVRRHGMLLIQALVLAACGGQGPSQDGTEGGDRFLAPAPTPAPRTWTWCAREDQVCNVEGTKEVRYGLNGVYRYLQVTGTVACTNDAFGGDPLVGVDKICEFTDLPAAPGPVPTPPPPPAWTFCAREDAVCDFEGTREVRYGLNGVWRYMTATDGIACTNDAFGGDPLFGADKICEYGTVGGTPAPGPTPAPTPTPTPTPAPDWTYCAREDTWCGFTGAREVRYGLNGVWRYKTASGGIACTNTAFEGDPVFGADKICEYGPEVPSGPVAMHSEWGPVIPFPIIPVAAANLPNGKLLTWSAYSPTVFGGDNGRTYTAIFDPVTGLSETRLVAETGHDMFCPGIAMLPDGTVHVTGGSSSARTSLYDYRSGSWSTGPGMNIPRGYQSSITLGDGSVLTLGGSWSGEIGGKHGEIWTAGGGWRVMTGIPIDSFIGPDPGGPYRGDNHLWLFTQPGGRVFHAGPAAYMNWIDTSGSGDVSAAGFRGDDAYSMNGNAVMYDIGKILKTGGAPAYEDAEASAASYVIDIADGNANVTKIAPMNFARSMHNSVVLPDGKVVITGGQTYVKLFSDERSVLMTEIWDPETKAFTNLKPMSVPRNYHSISILLPDGRVLAAGGGLCEFNCTVNHLDGQILTPPYLFKPDGTPATRPVITAAPEQAAYGQTVQVSTDSAVSSFVLMRLSSVTHSINTDQRRVPLQFTASGSNRYALTVPSDPGIAPPGYYMLFALDAAGVPSVSTSLRIQ